MNIRSMSSLETLDETFSNIQESGTGHNPTNDRANHIQEEQTAPLENALQPSRNIAQSNAISIPLLSNMHEAEL